MAQLSAGDMIRQEATFAGALVGANPNGDIYFVDSTNGDNGNDGLSRRHPKATLVNALASMSAGDTVVLSPGGSETVTSTVTVSLARVRIVSPTVNPESGYTITGAGTVDLMTVSGADVHIEGLRFTRSAGAGSTTAALLTTAAAVRLVVKGCSFDCSDLTSAWTNYGIELTDAITDVRVEGCVFRDCHRGILSSSASGAAVNWVVSGCDFWIGQSTAFGIHVSPTGTVRGMVVRGNRFLEADGDGTSATDAWDGTDNTDATTGPILMGANCDQVVVSDNRAYTALAQAFDTLNAVNAGAASDFVLNATGAGSATEAAVNSVGVVASSGLSATVSYGVAGSTANSSGLSATVSYGLVGSTANSSSLSAAQSVGVVGSSGLSATVSYGLAGSTANSSSLSAALSVGVVGSSGLSATVSYGLAGSTANSSSLSAAQSVGVVGSSGLSATVSYGLVGSTANSSGLSATVSYGVAGSTAHSTSLVAVQAAGNIGVMTVGSLADTSIANNTQGAGNTLATASGDVLITEILIAKDSTSLTGPTNVELSSDNAFGLTGAGAPQGLEVLASFQANENVAATGFAGTPLVPFVLESGKKVYIHGDDAAGSSGGNTRFAIIGTALSAGGGLT